MPTIALIGTLDTKGREYAHLAELIRARGPETLLIDVGTGGDPQVPPDVTREAVAEAGGLDRADLGRLIVRHDRGECVAAMSKAAPALLAALAKAGKIDGAAALGGGGGTSIATAAMRALPVGFPKLMVSTLASGNTAHYVGTSDIAMLPSVVDVAGLNRISRTVLSRAAGAICGMVESAAAGDADGATEDKPLVAASMFGNTTDCVNAAQALLEEAGYEVLVFHATGAGGRTMEHLIRSGLIAASLDITTTEWVDQLLGGVLAAGEERLDGAAEAGIPSIVVPGCLDMVNFGEPATVPERFAGRTLYHHNPQVTLMRTDAEECAELGRILAEKVNACSAPVTVLLPLRAISVISAAGGPFHDPAADDALFAAIRENLCSGIEVRELDLEINDPAFAAACVQALLENVRAAGG